MKTIDSPGKSAGPTAEPGTFLAWLARFFNERAMGFLALVALATALGPIVFDVSPELERALTFLEWLIVSAFATEFVIQGAAATDRRAWLRSPWRIVDLITVLGPVAALLPQVSDVARGSLALRLLRVGRAVAFGTRAGTVAARDTSRLSPSHRPSSPRVSVVGGEGELRAVGSSWESFLAWTRTPGACWFHASDLSRENFQELARSAGFSEEDLARVLDQGGNARLHDGSRHATLLVILPTVAENGFPEVTRDRVLALVSDHGILTATTGSFDLPGSVERLAKRSSLPVVPLPARIVCALLSLARERNQFAALRFDDQARRLEALEGGNEFLRDTFRLRREISAAALDLWHLKEIVRALADGKAKIRGVDLKEERYLDDLLSETASLHETVNKSKEELKSLIELHINFKSFEMNKFLKLLAIVSFLGLIPSVAGGLLGMNVAGNPWPVTLGQVAFGVVMGMATALYVFAMKRWLK